MWLNGAPKTATGTSINFDWMVEPGWQSTNAYGQNVGSNQVYKNTIEGGGLPPFDIYEGNHDGVWQVPDWTNCVMQNSNVPSLFPYANARIQGTNMPWTSSNVYKVITSTNFPSLHLAVMPPGTTNSPVTEITTFTICWFQNSTGYEPYDINGVSAENGYGGTWGIQDGSTHCFYVENSPGGDSTSYQNGVPADFNLPMGDMLGILWDAVVDGTGTMWCYDLTTHTYLGTISVSYEAGTPQNWITCWELIQTMHTGGISGTVWDFAWMGGITNFASRFGNMILPTQY